jgi:PBP1b-binding outer membrane lipoprotein LpoB
MNQFKLFSLNVFLLIFLIFFIAGCFTENQKTTEVDSNKSVQINSNQNNKGELLTIAGIDGNMDGALNEILKRQINLMIPELKKAYPKPATFDYTRLENSFTKLLLENKSNENLRKYQFICDENERWIYRCNMESGEIECFSMSSNKLRLLSSIK